MVQLPNADGFDLPGAIHAFYDQLYKAREVLASIAVTPRGQQAIGELDKLLHQIYGLIQAVEVWGPMIETNPEIGQLLASAASGQPVTDADAQRLFTDLGIDPSTFKQGDNPDA